MAGRSGPLYATGAPNAACVVHLGGIVAANRGYSEMKASRYNVVVDEDGSRETILYNTLYGSMTVWEPDEMVTVKAALSDDCEGFADDPRAEAIQRLLAEQRHIVPNEADELGIAANRKIEGIRDSNRLDVIVMPTLDCNFACTYCYEKHHASAMTPETQAALEKWLGAEMPRHAVTLLNWFGGEPLLAYKTVVALSNHATEVARQSGTSLVIHMTTNGYLLSERRILALLEVGLFDYQITLDGPSEFHDRMRVLRNGGATFRRVFDNAIMLASAHERVRISLRVNFNHKNIQAIPKLLRMIPDRLRPQFRPVFEPIFGGSSVSATENLPAESIATELTAYYALARELGFDVVLGLSPIHVGKLVYCYAERENQVIVSYNGDVFKCSVGSFERGERTGYIDPQGRLVKEDNWWRWVDETQLFEEHCEDCVYLPLCMGGCRKMRLVGKGTGQCCALVPTNTCFLLKQIAFGNFESLVRGQAHVVA